MSYMKEAWADLSDELDAPEPMQPIRLDYLTMTRDIAIQTDVLARLGLVHTFVGRQLYALNEHDSLAIQLDARASLMREGNDEPRAMQIADRCEQLLSHLVVEQAQERHRTALRHPSRELEAHTASLRAEADQI